MTNNKKTSKSIASEVRKILKDPNTSQIQNKLESNALSQVNSNSQMGSKIEDLASKVLDGPKYNIDTKSLSRIVLLQANKRR